MKSISMIFSIVLTGDLHRTVTVAPDYSCMY